MTREDTQDLLAMMQAAYPNYNPHDKTAAINVWKMALEEYDRQQVFFAFKAYVMTSTSGFAPSPGQLIEQIHNITTPQELGELEAWSLVSSALRNGVYGSAEEFEKLPEAVQKAVGSPSQLHAWAVDDGFNENVASSNFMRSYKAVLQRKKEFSKLPESIRTLIEGVNTVPGISQRDTDV